MMTVGDLLQRTGQTEKLTATIWRPLCVAALNTEPEQACAQTFVNVLRDALFSGADASDFLISRAPLSQLFAAPMLSGLRQRGLNWLPAQGLQALTRHQDNRWHLQLRAQNILAEQVVLATPWHVSASMLHSVQPSAAMALERLQPEPIRTVYLAWPSHLNVRLPDIAMLRDDPAQGRPGQWLFAREHQQDLAIAAVVISAAGSIRIDNATIAEQAAKQVSDQLGLPKPVDQRCINEKRATFLCTPDRPQVSATEINAEPLPAGLFLAGDYCYHRYPATLEAATISARLAAQACRELLAPGRRDAQLSNA